MQYIFAVALGIGLHYIPCKKVVVIRALMEFLSGGVS